jgi:hypothetical protein
MKLAIKRKTKSNGVPWRKKKMKNQHLEKDYETRNELGRVIFSSSDQPPPPPTPPTTNINNVNRRPTCINCICIRVVYWM